jgi:phosphoribosylformylglycinamidine cyclo-ligase
VVEKENVINGRSIVAGDVVLGLASNGAHSNGYSLVRKILERDNPELDTPFDGEKTLREAIIAPTRLYVKPILAALKQFTIKGMAHITGGGITENIPRVLPTNTVAQIDASSWELPKLFQWLQQGGNVAAQEMYRTFNCGIGMAIIVSQEEAAKLQTFLTEQGETVYTLGHIRERNGDEHQTQVA